MKRREFIAAGAAAGWLSLGHAARAEDEMRVTLTNDLWAIVLEPRTLRIMASPVGRGAVTLSVGTSPGNVDDLVHGEAKASWTLRRRADTYRLSCELRGRDLELAITALQPGLFTILSQPASALGRGAMLPIAEGHYVAADDERWISYLAGRRNDLDTTQDLTLPLWGLDHGEFGLHWLLTNPFNNRLHFQHSSEGLGLEVSHEFPALDPAAPMTMLLHLADADLLAGARRYRRHLVESGSYETLEAKIAKTPATERLIGAPHVYLWGTGLIGRKDVRDWPGFVNALRSASTLATRLRNAFEDENRALLQSELALPNAYQKGALVTAINQALLTLARAQWQTDDPDMTKLVSAYSELKREFVADFGAFLDRDSGNWGEGLSLDTIEAIRRTGIERMWIGMGDWEGGLWHPATVRAAVDAGYLIGPYDSYETAIAPGLRPDWITAQLGKAAFETCGVIRKDGSVTAGFQKTGVYTNMSCMLPLLKARVQAIAAAVPFNSWFIDVTASGMVFDDYRDSRKTSMRENAAANVGADRWLSESMQFPTGSEDGRAVTSGGISFAHGTETPVIGWGDPDLQKNTSSPFFLGIWHPPTQPSIFFKPVPMKEPYRTLHFAPENRLPLYQAVFHGSIISSHHWGYDNLKLTNVAEERELAQLLYNVAPLFHLSTDGLDARLAAIHRQYAFFRATHEALAKLSLDRFEWLSDDRLVQQTTFADGSRLIANFGTTAYNGDGVVLPPKSVVARLAGGVSLNYNL